MEFDKILNVLEPYLEEIFAIWAIFRIKLDIIIETTNEINKETKTGNFNYKKNKNSWGK